MPVSSPSDPVVCLIPIRSCPTACLNSTRSYCLSHTHQILLPVLSPSDPVASHPRQILLPVPSPSDPVKSHPYQILLPVPSPSDPVASQPNQILLLVSSLSDPVACLISIRSCCQSRLLQSYSLSRLHQDSVPTVCHITFFHFLTKGGVCWCLACSHWPLPAGVFVMELSWESFLTLGTVLLACSVDQHCDAKSPLRMMAGCGCLFNNSQQNQ